ncbi:MAG: allophanate hydrolase [Pseudomonadota bacterium]
MSLSLNINTLRGAYRAGSLRPTELVEQVLEAIADDPHRAWISMLPREQLMAFALALEARDPESLPLYGIPFAIKDNIDLAGLPTTAGCPDYAYQPAESAFVVQRLIDAGAIPIGKTNLDQFATGLNGTRSPYGACRNAFDPDYIAGGSSSGSAVAVALGQVSFALGTDTAGSGRVPAAFNNLIGLKPTRGLLSTRGVVPACRSLDCVSIFALTSPDAAEVLRVVADFDPKDAYARPAPADMAELPARPRIGVPLASQLDFFDNPDYAALFEQALAQARMLDAELVPLDITPLLEAARLLYEGPWVAERYAAIRAFIETQPKSLHPVTRAVIEPARKLRSVDAFDAMYRLQELKRASEALWTQVDCLLLPTASSIYRIADMEADPQRLNSALGRYTNFMNLLDLCGVAVPAGFTPAGLPFGVTLCAPAWRDMALLELAGRFQQIGKLPLGATGQPLPDLVVSRPRSAPNFTRVAVCGAHMEGLPLNHELSSRGGRLISRTRTAPCYRLYALAGGPPQRPGLVRDDTGAHIALEVWELPLAHFGSFVAGIPAPLGIGTLSLEDGSTVQGFVCEAYALGDARDITEFGGWRAWLQRMEAAQAENT